MSINIIIHVGIENGVRKPVPAKALLPVLDPFPHRTPTPPTAPPPPHRPTSNIMHSLHIINTCILM